MAFLSSGGGLVNDQLVRSYQAEVARRAAAVRQKLSFLSPSDQDAPILTAGGSPPMVPPSDREVGGAAPSGAAAAAFAGTGVFNAHATVVRPEPNAGSITQGPLSRIETDCANLLALAISLEKLARNEIGRLSGERPNDPHTIENNNKQCDLLTILADGFARLAAALTEYSASPQPLLAGKAKRTADDLSIQFEVWWEKNRGEAIDWAVRIPTLTASIAALGWTGANMTYATAAVSALIGGPKVIAAIKAATKYTKRR